MFASTILPALMALGSVREVHCGLKVAAEHRAFVRQDPAVKDIGTAVGAVGKDLEKAGDAAARKVQKGPGEESSKKPMMDDIEVMRAMMCWGRPKLIEHEDCMNWMVGHCKKETTAEGYCKKLRKYIKSKCKKGQEKACGYATDLGIDMKTDKEKLDPEDEDGDGVKDKDDAFPDNPMEWKDSDGDGVGDNHDMWPTDPTCARKGDVCGGPSPAPAPAPAASPVAAPAPAPSGLKMDENVPLPSQGFNEHSNGLVAHDDMKTMTRDWRSEWPLTKGNEETSVKNICKDNPKSAWCKLTQSAAARKAYARSHP